MTLQGNLHGGERFSYNIILKLILPALNGRLLELNKNK